LILSNPPYIKVGSDKHLVHKSVQRYEPEVALYLADEIYETWFKEFFTQIEYCLNPKGLFIMEGHENHLEGLAKLLPSNGTMKFYYDLTGRLRGLMWGKY